MTSSHPLFGHWNFVLICTCTYFVHLTWIYVHGLTILLMYACMLLTIMYVHCMHVNSCATERLYADVCVSFHDFFDHVCMKCRAWNPP